MHFDGLMKVCGREGSSTSNSENEEEGGGSGGPNGFVVVAILSVGGWRFTSANRCEAVPNEPSLPFAAEKSLIVGPIWRIAPHRRISLDRGWELTATRSATGDLMLSKFLVDVERFMKREFAQLECSNVQVKSLTGPGPGL